MFAISILRGGRRIAEKHLKCITSKRYAGHSKWQNTRHIREAKNKEKSEVANDVLRRMRSAVLDVGGSPDPKDNYTLRSVIDDAVKANVPKETWMKYLQKLQAGGDQQLSIYLTGPKRSVLLLTFSCMEANLLRQKVKSLCKKTCFERDDKGDRAFQHRGRILAKLPSTVATEAEAEEAAINSGAEEVEPHEDEGVFQFSTSPGDLNLVTKGLRSAGWDILESSMRKEPKFFVELSEEEVEEVSKDIQKFIEMPEYVNMIDNISLGTEKR